MVYDLLLERFLRYVKINTRSDENATRTPTTQSQVDFALKVLKPELEELGLSNIHYLESNGYLVATLPANDDQLTRKIGFISHMDTADFNAEGVSPQVIDSYDGGIIPLGNSGYNLDPADFPNLKNYVGQTLITTDGTTLLGADDKSGIAEIMTALAYLKAHPEIKHCEIRVGFGPDEEIGRGADQFDAPNFPVAFAYTIDSGRVGHFEYETFNAAQAVITIEGTSVHPGTAYGSLVNAIKLGEQLDQSLPQKEVPEQTRGNEGFYLLNKFTGSIEKAELVYIIRDHDQENFQARKQFLEKQVQRLNALADKPRLTITFQDQYYNMKEIIEKDWTPVELAVQAMESCDIEPIITPFRGGTDGSKISFMSIPTPNLFTGGENFHGQYEFITVESMAKAVQTIIAIIRLNAN